MDANFLPLFKGVPTADEFLLKPNFRAIIVSGRQTRLNWTIFGIYEFVLTYSITFSLNSVLTIGGYTLKSSKINPKCLSKSAGIGGTELGLALLQNVQD